MTWFPKAIAYLIAAFPAVAQSQAFANVTIKPSSEAGPRTMMRLQVLPYGDLIAKSVPWSCF